MKAKIYDEIETMLDIQAEFSDRLIPKGTLGTIVECYEQPEGYAVDLAIPDEGLIGGFSYENLILSPDQFVVMTSATKVLNVGTR